ncbi:hypothetical protein KKC44_00790 [Patescibacteria group bacterium]|nr:hypothetical protein [Patescibacteria group bacterium]MBU2259120.1 hypothetical protein [Patescibacteria group bacterium]
MKRFFTISLITVFLIACGSGNSSYSDNENEGGAYVGNPYSDGTGHYAGYEWAERTGGSCNGNSQSFNEGCEEYYRQIGE